MFWCPASSWKIFEGHINQAKLLTVYAVDARYPGDYEPVSKEEYNEALKIAEDVFKWLDNIIKFEE